MTHWTRFVLPLAALCLVSSAGAFVGERAAGADELRAFERAKRETDVLRAPVAANLRVIDSRRIAVHQDRRGRRATLYVAKTRTQLCVVLVNSSSAGAVGGTGGGCSPKESFFQGRNLSASSGRLFSGVVSNAVARVVLVGSRGVRHPLRVTADGGFIYDCRAYNGCAGLIACVEAYARNGALLSGQPWLPGGCKRDP